MRLHKLPLSTATEQQPRKTPKPRKHLEELCVFWRLICDRRWINQQLLFVAQKLDEIGRMIGGWLKQVERSVRP